MRVKIILNPAADRGRASHLRDRLHTFAPDGTMVEVVLAKGPEHIQAVAAEAAAAGYDVVAAAGGDGTIHHVVNGLLRDPAPSARRTALGLIPLGTGNDYAFGLGLDAPPTASVQRLFNGERRSIDAARVNLPGESYFACNGIGVGFDAAIAIESNRIQAVAGFPAYLLATLRTILFRFQTPHMAGRFDTTDFSQPALLLAVGIGPRVGGGFRVTPDASFTDGQLDICLVRPLSRPMMLAMLLRVMRGTHTGASFVSMRRSRSIEIVADRPLPIHVDGEIIADFEDNVREITITSLPGALDVIH
ncbi:MAG: diacylglycerol kinase family lipid kinase [Candidatus Promineifilaceae bacterium]|nr:diacylglycerol kinase family lipid kinase [Candidatus Promineifilaceae bacterium]